jgi:hypothetical protein
MKLSPLDYEIAKLIDEKGIDMVLGALCRETRERGLTLLCRRLETIGIWLAETGGKRRTPAKPAGGE